MQLGRCAPFIFDWQDTQSDEDEDDTLLESREGLKIKGTANSVFGYALASLL